MKMPTATAINLVTVAKPSAASSRNVRGGFTLVELLVVLGIIALLAAIVTVGIFSALGNTGDRATSVRLETLKTMYGSWEQDARAASNAGAQAGGRSLPSTVRTSMATAASGGVRNGAEVPPDSAEIDIAFDGMLFLPANEGSHEIWALRTQQMMRRMLSINTNRELFASLPDEAKTSLVTLAPSLVFDNNGVGSTVTADDIYAAGFTGEKFQLDPPLMLDSQDGLILFVPPGGLVGMTNEADPTWQYDPSNPLDGDRLVPKDGRGFFMSAGNDGSFQTHDDNLYSTELIKVSP